MLNKERQLNADLNSQGKSLQAALGSTEFWAQRAEQQATELQKQLASQKQETDCLQSTLNWTVAEHQKAQKLWLLTAPFIMNLLQSQTWPTHASQAEDCKDVHATSDLYWVCCCMCSAASYI